MVDHTTVNVWEQCSKAPEVALIWAALGGEVFVEENLSALPLPHHLKEMERNVMESQADMVLTVPGSCRC